MRIVGALTLCFVLLATTEVEARRGGFLSGLLRGAAKAAPHINRQKTYDVLTLTQAKLKECIQLSSALDDAGKILDDEEKGLSSAQEQLQGAFDNLELQRSSIDNTSQFEVDEFNRRLDVLRAEQTRFNDAVDKHNNRVSNYQSHANRFNTTCAGKRYYEEDLQLVEAELGMKLKP
jgi:hypothetical protein